MTGRESARAGERVPLQPDDGPVTGAIMSCCGSAGFDMRCVDCRRATLARNAADGTTLHAGPVVACSKHQQWAIAACESCGGGMRVADDVDEAICEGCA